MSRKVRMDNPLQANGKNLQKEYVVSVQIENQLIVSATTPERARIKAERLIPQRYGSFASVKITNIERT